MYRDPRIHPKKGDVIRLPEHDRSDYCEIADVTNMAVFLYDRWKGKQVPSFFCALTEWPRRTDLAEVVRLAAEPDPAASTQSMKAGR